MMKKVSRDSIEAVRSRDVRQRSPSALPMLQRGIKRKTKVLQSSRPLVKLKPFSPKPVALLQFNKVQFKTIVTDFPVVVTPSAIVLQMVTALTYTVNLTHSHFPHTVLQPSMVALTIQKLYPS